MKTTSQNLWFAVVLLVLAILAAAMWWADPHHRSSGPSRLDWPHTPAAQP